MRDDYLWDGSGEPDPEIQRLESMLGRLRHNRPAPVFPDVAMPRQEPKRHWSFTALVPRLIAATVACVATLTIAALSLWFYRTHADPVVSSEWNVRSVQGSPRLAGKALPVTLGAGDEAATGNLGVGQVLETDATSTASLRAEETGEIQVEPGTRLRLVKSRSGQKRLTLDRGTIQATIWAAPGEFVVDTPSALAVDLGCVYTLKVDDSGNGLIHTALGWVGFKLGNRESFIPAGAACATRKKAGPGTPYFEDASPEFRRAVAQLDAENVKADQRAAALEVVLSQSRSRDALTLWHLLPRVPEAERGRVYDRLAQLVAPPAQVTREGILRLDPQMLDVWWNELGYGDVSLWRHWERSWSEAK
jgi:hypothetical protein